MGNMGVNHMGPRKGKAPGCVVSFENVKAGAQLHGKDGDPAAKFAVGVDPVFLCLYLLEGAFCILTPKFYLLAKNKSSPCSLFEY